MSRAYNKWQRAAWDEEPFCSLSKAEPNGQTLFLALSIGPHMTAIPGVSRCGRGSLADSLGWEPGNVLQTFGELEARGLAVADWAARIVFLIPALDHNVPENPNGPRAWRRAFNELPACDVRAVIDQHVRTFLMRQDVERAIYNKASGEVVEHAWIRAWDPTYKPSPSVPETLPVTFGEPSPNIHGTLVEPPSNHPRSSSSSSSSSSSWKQVAEAAAGTAAPAEAFAGPVHAGGRVGGVGEGNSDPAPRRFTCGCGAKVFAMPTGEPGQYVDADGAPHVKTDACDRVRRMPQRKAAMVS